MCIMFNRLVRCRKHESEALQALSKPFHTQNPNHTPQNDAESLCTLLRRFLIHNFLLSFSARKHAQTVKSTH